MKPVARRSLLVAGGLLVLLATSNQQLATALADTVYLLSGAEEKGLVVEEHRDRVVLSTEEGEKTFMRDQIDEVFYSEPERNYLYLGEGALSSGNLDLSQAFFRKALQINPGFTQASDALERLEQLVEKKTPLPQGVVPIQAVREHWGMILEEDEPFVRIQEVEPEGLAERAGLAPGDRLVAVWSLSLGFLQAQEVAELLVLKPTAMLKLTVEREVRLPAVSGPRLHGLRLSMEPLGLTVRGVEEGAGLLAGLRAQDRIVAIDGQSTRYLPLGEADRRILGAQKEGVALRIHRDIMVGE